MFKIHKSFYLFILIAVLSGAFINSFIIFTLIIIHELGHFIFAKKLNVEVDKIYIYPLGGISKFNLELNAKPIIEFVILIMGPLFQCISYKILIMILPNYHGIITEYHHQILMFNLLPIYPLDGGKLLNIILSLKLPYKRCLYLSVLISYITIFLIVVSRKQLKLNIIIMIILLLYKVGKEKQKIILLYEKFLLERTFKNYKFNKLKIINSRNDFYKNYRHIIKENNKYYYENDYLLKKIKKN